MKIGFIQIERMVKNNPQYCQGNADDFVNAFANEGRENLPWKSTPPAWLESEMFKSLCINEIEMKRGAE